MKASSARGPLIALALGVGSAFAFEPAGLWPLMLLAFAGLSELLLRAPSLKRALLIGWLFGLGQFAVGLNWIATAFTYQAAMPAWLGWIAVVLLSLYLAVYPMLAAGLAWALGRPRPIAMTLVLAGGWAITEWLRAGLFTGFAWNPAGVVLIDTPWLGTATHIGTYGLSMLVVLAGGALWLAVRRHLAGAAGLAAALALMLLLPSPMIADCCLVNFDLEDRPAPPPSPLTVEAGEFPPPPPPPSVHAAGMRHFGPIRIVQPNIGQDQKWRTGFADQAAQKLAALSVLPGGERPRLLFWPEAAVTEPLFDQRQGPYAAMAEFERVRAASVVGPGEYLLTGGIAVLSGDGLAVDGAANSVFVLAPDGEILFRYDKAHLVPYGEYLPMRPLLSAIGLSRLAPGNVDFVPGPGPQTFALPGWGKVGFQICYEIIFSGEVASDSDRPDFIFNPSNDAWFGAWGPPQHLAQAQLRAAEEGLPVIRATPTGISAVIDARGELVETIGWREAGLIDARMPARSVFPTPFAKLGNLIPLALAFALLIAGIALGARGRYRRKT